MIGKIPEDLYGIIGWPLNQTLSPLAHNAAFEETGVAAVYFKWPLPPADLKIFTEAMRLYKVKGCSVTIPHKVAVLEWLDGVSEAAALAGAANTIYGRDGGYYGENTDVAGFLAPLDEVNFQKTDALLLGAGGAARAAAAGLKLRGFSNCRVASPGDKSQYLLAERFGFEPVKWKDRYARAATLVINATPLGMVGPDVSLTPYDFSRAHGAEGGYAYDLVYNPLETVFLKSARAAGRKIISGLEMFYEQAAAQFRLWTGKEFPANIRNLLLEKLNSRAFQ